MKESFGKTNNVANLSESLTYMLEEKRQNGDAQATEVNKSLPQKLVFQIPLFSHFSYRWAMYPTVVKGV